MGCHNLLFLPDLCVSMEFTQGTLNYSGTIILCSLRRFERVPSHLCRQAERLFLNIDFTIYNIIVSYACSVIQHQVSSHTFVSSCRGTSRSVVHIWFTPGSPLQRHLFVHIWRQHGDTPVTLHVFRSISSMFFSKFSNHPTTSLRMRTRTCSRCWSASGSYLKYV